MQPLAAGTSPPPARITVGELASPQSVSVSQDDDLDTALALMRDSGMRRLLVVDGAGNAPASCRWPTW